MQKLNINGINISCDDVNCSDEEIILKLLVSINNDKYYDIKKLIDYINRKCDIETILSIASGDVDHIDDTIVAIDRLVKDLTNHKAKLQTIKGQKMLSINNTELDPDIELEFETIDCEDKVIVLKIPSINIIRQSAIKKVMNHIKSKCNAKEIIAIPDAFKFEAMDRTKAIKTIDSQINSLYDMRDKLIEG